MEIREILAFISGSFLITLSLAIVAIVFVVIVWVQLIRRREWEESGVLLFVASLRLDIALDRGVTLTFIWANTVLGCMSVLRRSYWQDIEIETDS